MPYFTDENWPAISKMSMKMRSVGTTKRYCISWETFYYYFLYRTRLSLIILERLEYLSHHLMALVDIPLRFVSWLLCWPFFFCNPILFACLKSLTIPVVPPDLDRRSDLLRFLSRQLTCCSFQFSTVTNVIFWSDLCTMEFPFCLGELPFLIPHRHFSIWH